MFTPKELEAMPLELEGLFKDLEQRIMSDIIRRIQINGEITRSADWQIYRLTELGISKREIKQRIRKTLKLSQAEVERLYQDAIEQGYARNENLYKSSGRSFIPFADNAELQTLISATIVQTNSELKNITQSLGFAVKKGNKLEFTPIAKYYQRILDGAMLDIASGAFDHNTVIKRTVSELTNSGLRTVDYATGWSNRVEVASRRAVMSGISQLASRIDEDNAQALDTNLFEVSHHIGARPSHQVWQGKVYTKEQLTSICGLGTGAGLCGWNCYHSYYPFVEGISERSYTNEQLAYMNDMENTPKLYNGREYTTYEALQYQRRLETKLRAERQSIKLLQDGRANESDLINARAKYRVTSSEYTNFSKAMGLPGQRERVLVDGLGSIGKGRFTNGVKERIIKISESFIVDNPVRLPDGNFAKLVKDSEIRSIKVFAGKGSDRELRVRDFLVSNYGGNPNEWQHTKGRGFVNVDGVVRKAMLHWFEEKTVGIKEIKLKGWSKE